MRTQGKWEVKFYQHHGCQVVVEVNEESIIEYPSLSLEDAEYICKAVNSHEDLVRGLRLMRTIDPKHIPFGYLDKIENLLQSIEGE